MSLQDQYKTARIIETIENYALAGDHGQAEFQFPPPIPYNEIVRDDERFWRDILRGKDELWNHQFYIDRAVYSSWVARIPGLFWQQGSEAIRQTAKAHIELRGDDWVQYYPPGKSGKVLGGIGTYLFPPDPWGNTLGTLTLNANVSSGIPILIAPEVMEYHRIKDGNTLEIKGAVWTKMSMEWSQRFPSTKDIPKGYLVVKDPDLVKVTEEKGYAQFHPFSIMEYAAGSSLSWDFVYLTVDTGKRDHRAATQRFFEDYRRSHGDDNSSRYLISCDIADPLFDAQFPSPMDIQRGAYEKAQFELIRAKIRATSFNGQSIGELARKIPEFYKTAGEINTLAGRIDVSRSRLTQDAAARMSVQLLDLCLKDNKVEELLDRMAMDNPGLFNS